MTQLFGEENSGGREPNALQKALCLSRNERNCRDLQNQNGFHHISDCACL